MGKLGKKARKFAKKNLQSVLKRRRKTKALFKKKSSSKEHQDTVEVPVGNTSVLSNGRDFEGEEFQDASLDAIFSEDYKDVDRDASDSDGFLSEDSSSQQVSESEGEINLDVGLSTNNRKVYEELAMQKEKLTKLKKKDLKFAKFLASYNKGLEKFKDEIMDSDEDGTSNHSNQFVDEEDSIRKQERVLTSSLIDSWSQRIREEHDESALTCLLNGYRAACHYGSESFSKDAASHRRVLNGEAFCSVLMLTLREADNIFRGLLKISSSNCKKETILELKNTSKWKNLRPFIKSYLRSTIFLLNQITDSEMLIFILTRLRASIVFFAAFPALLRRLIKLAVHLWATGEGDLSSCSFFILRDVAVVFSSECFETCLIQSYKAYIAHSKAVELVNFKHIELLRNSFVELCSLDVYKSCPKALTSIQQLLKILKPGLHTKKKEALQKICSWEYVNCIDLWVMFISANMHDYDLHHMFYTMVRLINGVACLFPGPRYLPLRLKCIEWLNHLSRSSGIFIPVVSLVLDVLEYKRDKEGGKPGRALDLSSILKLPKHWLKSRNFKEQCVFSAIELLVGHFAQWSYHISFPELATIPLIRLNEFHEVATTESLKRAVKRLIDQVEQNVEFVQKKRDEVAFSPKDHQSVESFLQLEKFSFNAPFTQYYKSIMEKSASRISDIGKISALENKRTKRKRGQAPA